ncbi:MAG TPA: cell wall-binding repeat-containing protein, partial [Solirubrobacterales bacterium]
VPVYVLGPSSTISPDVESEIAKIDGNVQRVAGKDPVGNAIAFARYSDGDFGWNINDPGHGFVIARSDSPLDAAAAAPLSAAGTWGPLLLTDNADTLPDALRGYLLDVKPGYTTDPTRAFYNHVWVIGDQDAIDVNQQAEIDSLAELTKIGGQP